MIESLAFGRTGHDSTRILFGAAALSAMSQARADATLELVQEYAVDHIDVAASYGEAELRLAPVLARLRDDFFLATKTGDRTYAGAKAQIEASRARMQVDQIDMIQLHDLTDEPGWEAAFGADGALRAAVEARDAGHVRFIGVTGHGTQVAAMHLRSLERFPFDSVLLPYNFTMMQDARYAEEFEVLLARCATDGVAVQTIKCLARRRWRDADTSPRFSWYEPIREPEALSRAVSFALERPGVFVNSSSDATLLRTTLAAAVNHAAGVDRTDDAHLHADVHSLAIEPLFVRGVSDVI